MEKELLLLQEHELEDCPCETGGEMCKRKHLLTIEAYAEETLSMELEVDLKEKLQGLCREAKDHRKNEEKALCGVQDHENLGTWARDWRKSFEAYSLSCELYKNDLKGN